MSFQEKSSFVGVASENHTDESSPIETHPSPDRKAMRLHLGGLFNLTDPAFQDGMIEISRLTVSRYFSLSEFDAAIDLAIQWNEDGHNVYVCPTLLVPDVVERIATRTAKEGKPGRGRGQDFYASNVVWSDIDDPHDPADIAEKTKDAPPNFFVITGQKPHLRQHFYWILEKTESDPATIEAINKSLVPHLGSDRAAVDRTHLMRLAGSVAWPKKVGRIIEVTAGANTNWMPPHDVARLIEVYTLGQPIFDTEGNINPDIRFNALAAHIWFCETKTALSSTKKKSPLLGVHNGTAYYLLYNGILGDKTINGGNVLTTPLLAKLPAHDGPKVIYGETSRLSPQRLKDMNILFKQTPYDVKAR